MQTWGIGRELYTAPFIWVPAAKTDIQKKGDRYITKDSFSVQSISYSAQREIASLAIVNQKGMKVYELNQEPGNKAAPDKMLTAGQMKILEKELERTGIAMDAVLERYQIKEVKQMTPEIYKKALGGLKKTKPKEAA